MTKKSKQKLLKLQKSIVDGMVSYMQDDGAEVGYAQKHIDACSKIIEKLLLSLEKSPIAKRNEHIIKAVKLAVLALNKLNKECDHSLIETDQREDLCALIISAAKDAGLRSEKYDITEEWREW